MATRSTDPGTARIAELEAALKQSEARFRGVVEGSLQGIIIQQDGRIVYANGAMARLFGYDNSDGLIGRDPFADLITDSDLEFFRRRTDQVYRGARVEPTPPWRARRSDDRVVWLTSTAHPTEWQGRPAVTSFYLDVTERVLAEQSRAAVDALYRSALRAGHMGAWETDLVRGVRTWTAEGMDLFGITLSDGQGVVGGDRDEYVNAIHPEDRHLVPGFYELAMRMDSFPA